MKKLFKISAAIALLAACISCSDEFERDNQIRFSARTGQVGTKVSYSGQIVSNRERVDWKNGDMVWIWCPESERPVSHEASYVVYDIQEPDEYYSKAHLQLYSTEGLATGLQWNDDVADHHLYAIYPDPHKNRSVNVMLFMDTDPVTCRYGATVPASQPPLSVTTTDNGAVVAEPDCNNLIMVADGVFTKNGDPVNLDFSPVVTAVEFIVMNQYMEGTPMTLNGIKFTSTSSNLAGKFTSIYGSQTTNHDTNATNTVEIPFTDAVTVPYNKTFKFTVFFLGDENVSAADIDNVTIEFATGTNTSIKTLLKTSQGTMKFPRSKKSYVTGIIIPGPIVWTISAVPNAVTAWGSEAKTVEIEEE